MINKIDPKYIILIIATISSSLGAIIFGSFQYYLTENVVYTYIFIFFTILFLTVYILVYIFLRAYMLIQMKSILKIIPDFSKEKQPDILFNFDQNMMQNFNLKMQNWIDENKKEMDKYKVLSAYRRQFMGDISHELKTPLFSIQGYLHTLLDGAIHDSKNNILFLKRAAKSADRLESIIQDLDMISKLESGEMKYNYQNFNINKLITDVFEELHYIAKQKNITMQLIAQNKKKTDVYADPDKIWMVATNLISNAIHYGKENGFVKVSLVVNHNKLDVTVSDNGIGIQEKDLNHLFDRFYRVDSSRARNKGGSGLGLSIVKHVIVGHNQSIHVKSKQDEGSEFLFTLDVNLN
jgi:two-component system phosphate regulon sensor histidine kinase PhoR